MSGFAKSTLWATLGNWIQQGFSLVTLLVVARFIEPAAFGLITTALLFVLLVQRVLLESIGFAVLRAPELTPSRLDAAFALSAGGGVLLGGLLFAGSGVLATSFDEPGLRPVLMALAAMPLIDGLTTVQTGLLRRDMRFKALAMRTLWANLGSGVAGIALAYAGAGVWSLVTQQLISSVGGLVAIWVACEWRPGRRWHRADFRELAAFGLPMVGNALLFVLSNRLDVLVLAAASNASVTGTYSLAKRLVRAVTDLFVSGAVTVSLSVFSAAGNDAEARTRLLRDKLRTIAFIAYPLYAGLGCVAADLIPLLLGARWIDVVPTLQVLALFGLVQVPLLVGTNLLVSLGRSRDLLFFNLFSLCVLALAITTLVADGARGVATAFVLQSLITLPILLWRLRVAAGLAWSGALVAVAPPALATACMAAAMWLAQWLAAGAAPWQRVAAAIAAGLPAYLLPAILLMPEQWRMVFQMVRTKARRVST